jgi:hypothetical protein
MFNSVIVQLLQTRNITAYKRAHDIGISPALISQWKSGRYVFYIYRKRFRNSVKQELKAPAFFKKIKNIFAKPLDILCNMCYNELSKEIKPPRQGEKEGKNEILHQQV